MQLKFTVPADWITLDDDGWQLAEAPGREVALLATPLDVPSALSPVDLVQLDVPRHATVRECAHEPGETTDGWPFTRILLAVVDATGSTIELRVLVVYRVLGAAAALLVRVPDEAVYARHGQVLTAIFTSVVPDLRTRGPACVAEWFAAEGA